MLTSFFLAMLLGTSAQAKPAMHFQYVPNEGADALDCTYSQIRDLPDYDVDCAGQKRFTAHVIVRELQGGPATTLEILYWVTEPGATDRAPRNFHGSSTILKLKDKSQLASFSMAQAVENDYASLTLDYQP